MADDRNLVTIESDGQVGLDLDAQRRLAAHPGRYRVLPTTGDLILMQRAARDQNLSSRETSSSAIFYGQVALAGDVSAVGGLIDIIHFIFSNAWSGQLALVDNATRKTVHFRRGDIRTAASNLPEDRLGAILYRYGVVKEDALAEALKSSGGGARIGHVLVEQGALTAHDLYTYVRKQVEEIFFSLLAVREGSFYFYRTGDEEGPTSQLKLSTKALLFEGVRRIDELSYFRQKLPSPAMVLIRREPPPSERLGPREQRVLGLIDGKSDLAQIARLSHLGEFETTKTLFQLLSAGFVQIREQAVALEVKTVAAGYSVDDIQLRIIDTFNDVYVKIFAALTAKGSQELLSRGLESFFSSTSEFAPLFVGIMLEHDGRLPREALLANLHFAPTDNRIDYLHRGLNELLFFELFTAGEAVDRKEEFELHQRLDAILREVPTDHARDDSPTPDPTRRRSTEDAA